MDNIRYKTQRIFRHFMTALQKQREAVAFFQKHELWRGIFQYGWLSKALLIIAIVLGVKYFTVFLGWVGNINSSGFSTSSMMSLGTSSLEFWKDNLGWLFSDKREYLILILTEVITFHVVRSTIAILTNKTQNKSFDAFFKAQMRMIGVAAFSWVIELLGDIFSGIIFGFLPFDFLEQPLLFLLQCFLLGFALIDNYNEQYEMKITESAKRTIPIAGAAITLGLIFYLLLYIPIAGALLAPAICGVAAALLMLEFEQTEELLPYVPEVEEG
ncbi:MAG: hypothetical protein AAFO82_02525 [Bacteroidota bacterium]